MKKKLILLLTVILTPFLCVPAQETARTDTVSVKVYFRQGHSTLDTSFRGNGVRLEAFASRLREACTDTLQKASPVRIIGAASPEGSTNINEKLSEKRAASLAAWLRENFPQEDITYETVAVGIDWDGLTRLVEGSDMPYRDEVLDILHNTPEWIFREGKVVDGRKRQLGMLHGGKAWWYMYEHLFPELRNGNMEMACEIVCLPKPQPITEAVVPVPADTVVEAMRDTVILHDTITPVFIKDEKKPFYMAIKTNMLYDLLLVPNIGAEFSLGKGWSIGGNWMYAWWDIDRRHYYWRIYGGEINIRKYFGSRAAEKPLTGHHLGVYGQMLTYDFELGGKGYLGDRWSWGAGLEYGYSLPVAKRLNIDFGIGIGYLGGEYKVYDPKDGHYVWRETRQRHWFGPTKAEISLVWLIGHGNYNKGKGGAK